MKKSLLIAILLLQMAVQAQVLDENTFDFWVGNWEVSWIDEDGKYIQGINTIERILDGKVIQENFTDPTTNYNGMSLSIFNQKTKIWNQTWVDSEGAHYNFNGVLENGNPVFKTKMIKRDGEQIILKMIFKNISSESFIWEWMGTINNGENWNVLWKIKYERKQV